MKRSRASRSDLTRVPSASVPAFPSGRAPVDRILTAVRSAFLRALFASLAVLGAMLLSSGSAQAATPRVLAVEFDNDVNPVTQDYLTGEIARANRDGFDAVVLVLDTPGGLSESMRKIVKKELAS